MTPTLETATWANLSNWLRQWSPEEREALPKLPIHGSAQVTVCEDVMIAGPDHEPVATPRTGYVMFVHELGYTIYLNQRALFNYYSTRGLVSCTVYDDQNVHQQPWEPLCSKVHVADLLTTSPGDDLGERPPT